MRRHRIEGMPIYVLAATASFLVDGRVDSLARSKEDQWCFAILTDPAPNHQLTRKFGSSDELAVHSCSRDARRQYKIILSVEQRFYIDRRLIRKEDFSKHTILNTTMEPMTFA
jgi:hypothetical protein